MPEKKYHNSAVVHRRIEEKNSSEIQSSASQKYMSNQEQIDEMLGRNHNQEQQHTPIEQSTVVQQQPSQQNVQAQHILTEQSTVVQQQPSQQNIQAQHIPTELTISTQQTIENNSLTKLINKFNPKKQHTPLPTKPEPIFKTAKITGQSYALAHASVGLSHLNQKIALPCQDSVKATLTPRPILIACDGAGSSALSEVGSNALCVQLTRLCQSIEPFIGLFLDTSEPAQDLKLLVRVIIRHAKGVLQDLSEQYRREIKDFRSTLNFALVGKERILWIKVGDGEIIQQYIYYDVTEPENITYKLSCIGEQAKGEFANQTLFIDDKLQFDDVQWGELSYHETHGLALMSDGASEKLVSNKRDKVAEQINQWLDNLRKQKLKAGDIAKRFYAEDFNQNSTGDDRSITLWVQEFKV